MNDDNKLTEHNNSPLAFTRNTPLALIAQETGGKRRYTATKEINDLAITKFRKNGNGITFTNLIEGGVAKRKKHAQETLKHYLKNETIFTLRKCRPQEYFATIIKSEVMARRLSKNTPIDPTGVRYSTHPLSNTLELQKAQNLLDVLLSIPNVPFEFHKIQLQTNIDRQYYDQLPQDPNEKWKKNRGKPHAERMARADVKFLVYPNGKVMITIACSNDPFKVETDEDESVLFSFLGQVRDRLLLYLNDPRERTVLPIIDWRLIGCDINKDVEVTDLMQVTAPDIQLKYADRVFRLYIKSLGDRAVCRAEESVTINARIYQALQGIRNPNERLENKVDELTELVKTLTGKG